VDETRKAFYEHLASEGLRLTTPRRQILDTVLSIHSHFTAESLYNTLKSKHGQISRATLYRTLALLTESNVLEAQDFGGGSMYYEHKFGHTHHDHLVCLKCGSIIEFSDDRLEKMQMEVTNRLQFKPFYHALKISGLCSNCL
jgi:Fur family transcriptional regulator, ferric uptake regulator